MGPGPTRGPRRALFHRLGLVLALALVAAPVFYWSGGIVEEEALGFLGSYWSDRTAFQLIFNPRGYDFYQGRELSYAVDFLDAQWVGLQAEHDRFWFLPPSAVIASLGVVAVFCWGAPRALPGLGGGTAWLVLLLYLSNFVFMSTMGTLYRAAKPLVAPLLLFALLFSLRARRRPPVEGEGPAWPLFVAGAAMSLLDRQGLFYLGCLAVALGFAWLRSRTGGRLVLAATAAIGVTLVYNYLLGPWLVHLANGYWPSMQFQTLQPRWLADPGAWRQGLGVLRDWTVLLLGGGLGALVAVSALAVLVLRSRRRAPSRADPAMVGLLLLGAIAQVAMVAVMARRHEPVTWIDHRIWYYPLVYQVVVVFGLLWILERTAVARGGTLPRLVPVALACLVALNVAHWPRMERALRSGPWGGDVMRRSDLLKESLRTGGPEPLLDGDHRRFLFQCRDRFPLLAARMSPHVSEAKGVDRTEISEGGLFARGRRTSQVVAFAPTAGRYLLEGGVYLRPGERVSFALAPGQVLGDVARHTGFQGLELFSFPVKLSAGPTDVTLSARLTGAEPPEDRRFGLHLPFHLRPADD